MDKVHIALRTLFDRKLYILAGNDEVLRSEAEGLFQSLIAIITARSAKIKYFISNEGKTNSKALKISNDHFSYAFTFCRDGRSSVKFTRRITVTHSYDENFLKFGLHTYIGYVYFLKSEFGFKIGSSRRLQHRMKEFAAKLPFPVELHSFIRTLKYQEMEKAFHQLMASKRMEGEWFSLNEDDWGAIDFLCAHNSLERELAADLKQKVA